MKKQLVGMMTSTSQEWETPQDLFDRLDQEFDFTLDVCATKENTKCKNYYSIDADGLKQKWTGRCWMNPLYKQNYEWLKKAYQEVKNGDCELVVGLIPSRTDTVYFHEFILKANEIRFIKGRLKFSGQKNSAPFPSIIVVFKRRYDIFAPMIGSYKNKVEKKK